MHNRYSSNYSRTSLEAASEAAAKVNALLIAEGKLKLSQVNSNFQSTIKSGGLFVLKIDINDAPATCRNILTKGTTQEDIMKASSAAVSTRGRYIRPDDKYKVSADDRPLHLYLQGTTKQAINIAAKKINDILRHHGVKEDRIDNNQYFMNTAPINTMSRPPPILTPISSAYIRPPPPSDPAVVPLTFLQEKLYIGLEHAPPTFDVKNKIIGPGGCYLRHVMSETGAIVSLCGKGSGFDGESIEPMHIQIQHPSMNCLEHAKSLSSNLIQTIQQEYAQFQQALAALPQQMTQAPAPVIMGVQQQNSLPTLLGPPGIATLTSLTQQPPVLPPGLQPASAIMAQPLMPVSSPSSMILPTVSLTSSLPPTSIINLPQAVVSGPHGVMLPSSLSSSTTMAITAPILASALPTGQMVSHRIEGGNINSENMVLVPNTSVPPPIMQAPPQAQFDINPQPPNSQFIAVPAEGQILVGQPQQPTAQVTVVGPPQAVIQSGPGPLPAIITTPSGQTMELVQTSQQPQTLSIVGQPATHPPFSVQSSQPYSTDSSTSSISMSNPGSLAYNNPIRDEPKRRFTEDKPDESVPENLLGYQHGPLHMINQGNQPHGDSTNIRSRVNEETVDTTDKILMPPPPLPKGHNKRSSGSSEDEPIMKKDKRHMSSDYGYGDQRLDQDNLQSNGNHLNLDDVSEDNMLNNGSIDPRVQPYKVAASSAPTLYNAPQTGVSSYAHFAQPPIEVICSQSSHESHYSQQPLQSPYSQPHHGSDFNQPPPGPDNLYNQPPPGQDPHYNQPPPGQDPHYNQPPPGQDPHYNQPPPGQDPHYNQPPPGQDPHYNQPPPGQDPHFNHPGSASAPEGNYNQPPPGPMGPEPHFPGSDHPFSQPPPDAPQFIQGPPPEQAAIFPGQTIVNPPIPVVSIAVPIQTQPMSVVSSQAILAGQPIISHQQIPIYSQPVALSSQPLPVYSQSLPIPTQSTVQYREPSPQNIPWGAPAQAPPPPPPTSFYQNNQQPPPPQWTGQGSIMHADPAYSTPSSQAGFINGPPPPPPPSSIQHYNAPPPMPYWVGPN